jgi:hypothetical protein
MKNLLIKLEILLNDPGLNMAGHWFFITCVVLYLMFTI